MPQPSPNVDQSTRAGLNVKSKVLRPSRPGDSKVPTPVASQQLMSEAGSLRLEAENNTSRGAVSDKQRRHVKFIPDGKLCFQRPLTRSIYRSLIIANPSIYPVAFKIKTTHVKLYYARPSAGIIEPGENIYVTIESAPRPEDPPSNKRCEHKLLIETTDMNPERDNYSPNQASEGARESKMIKLYKFDVVYIPAKGLTQEEIAEYAAGAAYSAPGDLVTVFVGLHKANLPPAETESPPKDVAYHRPKYEMDRDRERISADCRPSYTLYFQRPLTRSIVWPLTIVNTNLYPIAYKIESKTPEFYFARPNSGKVEPGGNIQVTIEKKTLLQEPPLAKNCKHIFNIATAAIATEQVNFKVKDIIKSAQECGRAISYKIRVAYISAEDLNHLKPSGFAQSTVRIKFPAANSGVELQRAVEAREDMDRTFGLDGGKRMCISFYPRAGDTLCFQRPLINPIARSLVITNHNSHPVAYKLNTTAPKLYYARPGSGRVEPGQNVNITIEKLPLAIEPPPDEKCADQFLVEITPLVLEEENLPVNEIRQGSNKQIEWFRFGVKYISAEGLLREELAEYAAGMAHFIPEYLFSVYPKAALYFKKPLRNPANSTTYMAITNIYTRPMVYRVLIMSQNEAMYAVHPVSGRIESGEYLKIKVVRHPAAGEPLLTDQYTEMFCFQGAVIYPDQENLGLSDIWASAKSRKQAIYNYKLPVLFIPSSNFTPKEEAMRAQHGLFERLLKEDAEEFAKISGSNRPGQFEVNAGESCGVVASETLSKIQKWLLSIPKQPQSILSLATE